MRIDIGTRLHTKDGRRYGNGIIARDATDDSDVRRVISSTHRVFAIEFDDGQSTRLGAFQIRDFFHIGECVDVEQWRCDRLQAHAAFIFKIPKSP